MVNVPHAVAHKVLGAMAVSESVQLVAAGGAFRDFAELLVEEVRPCDLAELDGLAGGGMIYPLWVEVFDISV